MGGLQRNGIRVRLFTLAMRLASRLAALPNALVPPLR